MEPQIQYGRTSDGVSIAFTVIGSGPPIVRASGAIGDLHLLSSGVTPFPGITHTLAELGWSVINYDGRGMGSSARGNTDFSMDGRLRDLEAVIERVGADQFALWGTRQGGPVAISYAVGHPERVSRLVLSQTYAKGADYYQSMPVWRSHVGC